MILVSFTWHSFSNLQLFCSMCQYFITFYGQMIFQSRMYHIKCVDFPVFNLLISCDCHIPLFDLQLRGQPFRELLGHFPVSRTFSYDNVALLMWHLFLLIICFFHTQN